MDTKQKIEDNKKIRASYDRLASDYASRIYCELAHKPFDRRQLDNFANLVSKDTVVVDLGCGPGQIARYLKDKGVNACGLDLSLGMLLEARKLNPDIPFVQGDMLTLPFAPNQLDGIAAFYSIIHLGRDRLIDAFSEMSRVLRPNGFALIAFHLGSDVLHTSELWGHEVDLDATFVTIEEVARRLADAGFKIESAEERGPYHPDVEYQSRRGYVLAKQVGGRLRKSM
jgi:SAM-dependent methyltransferase